MTLDLLLELFRSQFLNRQVKGGLVGPFPELDFWDSLLLGVRGESYRELFQGIIPTSTVLLGIL